MLTGFSIVSTLTIGQGMEVGSKTAQKLIPLRHRIHGSCHQVLFWTVTSVLIPCPTQSFICSFNFLTILLAPAIPSRIFSAQIPGSPHGLRGSLEQLFVNFLQSTTITRSTKISSMRLWKFVIITTRSSAWFGNTRSATSSREQPLIVERRMLGRSSFLALRLQLFSASSVVIIAVLPASIGAGYGVLAHEKKLAWST